MTDLDRLRKEYQHALRSTYVSRDVDECGRTYDLVDEAAADALIAALEAEVKRLDDKLMEAEGAHENARRWFEEQKKQFARAEKAEAEARRWEWLAKEASLGRRTPDGPLLDTLLARYEEAHHA